MSVGIETVMNQLPQFVPAVTPFTTTDVQASATNTPGASTLSLRGLGANRNLVLIDGRRGMPVNALGAISINSIPSAAVAARRDDHRRRVVGVRRRRHGRRRELHPEEGLRGRRLRRALRRDGRRRRRGDEDPGVYGANFADDGGNVMMGFEYSSRGEVRSRDRDWQREIWEDPNRRRQLFRADRDRVRDRGRQPAESGRRQQSDALSHRRQRQRRDRPAVLRELRPGPARCGSSSPTARTASTVRWATM